MPVIKQSIRPKPQVSTTKVSAPVPMYIPMRRSRASLAKRAAASIGGSGAGGGAPTPPPFDPGPLPGIGVPGDITAVAEGCGENPSQSPSSSEFDRVTGPGV